ncbi:hypothetical protein A9Q91_02790 [Candidatus Gracilibacteria bacterium 28_42_T64]|nr:hypothetical protein A9Q91_02790 [Candidatus Gracilibacteria bacterium 28_42_T64]
MYFYIGYLIFLGILYSLYHIQYKELNFIPKVIFETKLQNVNLDNDLNGLVQLIKLLDINKQQYLLQDLYNESHERSKCIYSWGVLGCSDTERLNVISRSIKLTQVEIENIEDLNGDFLKLLRYKYFKQDKKSNVAFNFNGIASLAKVNLYYSIYNLEKGNPKKAISILSLYNKIGEKLIKSDGGILPIVSGITIIHLGQNNIEFILNNYNFSSDELQKLKESFSADYNSKDIAKNTQTYTYQAGYFIFDSTFRGSDIGLNKNHFYNQLRNFYVGLINRFILLYDNYDNSYMGKSFSYYFFENIGNISFEGYEEGISNINKKNKEIINKIDILLYQLKGK